MLRELRIRDFAIIDDLTINFRPGLNVITGETGAGKSVILQALALLCGGRATADLIRSDAEEATIEGLFDSSLPAEALEPLGLGREDELLVRRHMPRSGKGRIYVNGNLTTVSLMARLGDHLVHIYGQHEQALLLHPASHLHFLDQFGELVPMRERMATAYAELAAARHNLEELERRRAEVEQRRELLEFQRHELEAADVQPDEETNLRRERELLRHAERVQQVCRDGEAALYSGDAAMAAALTRLLSQLSELAAVAPPLAAAAELIDTGRVQLEEAALQLRAFADHMHSDPDRLDAIEERVGLLTRLSRKYGVPSNELAGILVGLQQDLESWEAQTRGAAAARETVDARQGEAMHLARELSAAREAAGRRLEKCMKEELALLGMLDASIRVERETHADDARAAALTSTGLDTVAFYLSANPGEAPRPLARIASGGELSRIMLALKALTATVSETPILIFDEVDAGIGGAVADAVARRLKALAHTRQLLCITHLAQIAAHADHHFAVEKRRRRGRTIAQARILAPDERVRELSRMLGGSGAPAEAERYARRLIAQGQR